jgi:RNAse (barnase) inhibitor barstar
MDSSRRAYVLDGERISSAEEFFREFGRVVLSGLPWGRNLAALDDVLRGGFGTPEGGFDVVWRHAGHSRGALGHAAMANYLSHLMARTLRCVRGELSKRIDAARNGEGATLFEEIVGIIRDHGPGGGQAEDGVRLLLEE